METAAEGVSQAADVAAAAEALSFSDLALLSEEVGEERASLRFSYVVAAKDGSGRTVVTESSLFEKVQGSGWLFVSSPETTTTPPRA